MCLRKCSIKRRKQFLCFLCALAWKKCPDDDDVMMVITVVWPQWYWPSLWVDDYGPRLVVLPPQHHTDSAAIDAGDVDDVGDLAGPVDEAAVDVDAEIVQLQTLTVSAQRAQHHCHALEKQTKNGQFEMFNL